MSLSLHSLILELNADFIWAKKIFTGKTEIGSEIVHCTLLPTTTSNKFLLIAVSCMLRDRRAAFPKHVILIYVPLYGRVAQLNHTHWTPNVDGIYLEKNPSPISAHHHEP